MRTRNLVILLLACTLLACSLTPERDEQAVSSGETPLAPPPSTGTVSSGEAPLAPPPSTGSPPTGSTSAVPYFGEESVEERIARADIVVKVELDRTTNTVVTGSGEYSDKYYPALKFHLTVSEYLKGSGASSITALWVRGKPFDTQAEAEDAAPGIATGRDTTWDDREAIFFLRKEDLGKFFAAALQGINDYYLSAGGTYQDMYSLHNIHRKLWLPSAGTTATGDNQEFLLAVPEPGLDTPTITLGELKRRITAVNAALNGGDGSDAYRECVRNKYQSERMERVRMSGSSGSAQYRTFEPRWSGTFASGQLAGAELYDYDRGLVVTGEPEKKTRLWLDGQDAGLFAIREGNRRSAKGYEENQKRFAYSVVSVRPIPAGMYEFNHHYGAFIDCGNTATFAITANVLAPEGTLHEAFFDPVTVGTAIAADNTNGVLKPSDFTDTNGASATIHRVAWEAGTGESGTVKLKFSPHNGIADHTLRFIALDGSVPLSLKVADATVDAPNATLSWTVASQPWQSGDTLMLRIRETPDCSQGAVPNPSANPNLVGDCESLLELKDTLRGTATLNWNATSTITTWDGVTTGGTPSRVTRLELANEELDGSIPSELGRLSELTHLDLSGNALTGEIPEELGSLSNLAVLRLSGNSLTGCIPLALMSVATNDLSSLDLLYCRPPAPENLSAGTPGETSVPLSWSSVSNTDGYRVEHRTATSTEWTVDIDNATSTSTSHTVDDLACGTDHRFRVSAHGSGVVYAAEWSEPSEAIPGMTSECRTPAFGASSYTFTVREDINVGRRVGTVSAAPPTRPLYRLSADRLLPGAPSPHHPSSHMARRRQ